MASKRLNELLKDFENNKQVKSITKFIKGKNKTNYYNYPKIKNNELVNNFIGTYCPMGYYNVNKRGTMKIVADRPILSQSKQMENNLKNFSCYDRSCNNNSSNTEYIENFDNIDNSESINYNPSIKNINNKITNITIIIFFLSISFLLFYKN